MADHWRRRCAGDAGFSLVEIMIAMIIFGIVAAATTPLLLGGLKAGRMSQLNLQAKALGQERLERMRNLPFHVARQNGLYLDVLDIYHRDLTAAGSVAAGDTCSARSYASTTKTYSCTITSFGADYFGFTQVVSTQFVNAKREVLAPPATYTSQVAGVDTPPANLLSVVVKTSWKQSGKTMSFTVRSYIANAQDTPNAITASVRASALQLTTELSTGQILQFEGGLISSEGALTTGSTASLSAVAARIGLSSGTDVKGAALSLTAPPADTGASPTGTVQNLSGSTCEIACFGPTAVTGNQQLTVASGEPKVSLTSNPVTATLSRSGSSIYRGFSVTNATALQVDPALELVGPMVSAGVTGTSSQVLRGSGYLDATGSGASSVTAGIEVGVPVLQLFPTAFAPEGVVQVQLDSASMTCKSGVGSASMTSTWAGQVRYWSAGAGGYVPLSIDPGATALPNPATLQVIPGKPLSTWVDNWSAAGTTASANETSGKRAKGTRSAVLSLLTTQTRPGLSGKTSPINLAVGSLTCVAEDAR